MFVEVVNEDDHQGVACPKCGRSMRLHQPEEERPDRLLGTCDFDHSWAVIDLACEGRAILIGLPEPTEVVAPAP